MTITIGALCDGGNKVLLLADKQLTTNFGLVFETNKSIALTPKCQVLLSGNPASSVFLSDIKKSISPDSQIKDIADRISVAYVSFRAVRFWLEYLAPHGFTSFIDFHAKQRNLDGVFVGSIIEQAKNYNLGLEILIGGVDETGGHIFHIQFNGRPECHDASGFVCAPLLGTGTRASVVFEDKLYSPKMKAEIVYEIVKEAHKRSMDLGGIGKDTSSWIIDSTGIRTYLGAGLESR